MKKIVLASLLSCYAATGYADMVISAVFDGPLTGGAPKGVELFVVENIADLSEYGIESANNGNQSTGQEFTFPAVSASAGDYIYVASEAIQFEAFFGFAPTYTSGAMSINGDDTIILFHNEVPIDEFGETGVDGTGQAWEYLDGWAARLSGNSAVVPYDSTQWTFSGPNALDDATSNASAESPIPVGVFTLDDNSPEIVINEVDSDTAGTDTAEFIELFDGGLGFTSLDGLSVVLYNGSNDASYNAFDLDGYTTNEAGYFVLGNAAVSEADLVIGSDNIIQNGADAVVLVEGDASDYPNDTAINTDFIVDAIVYDTNDSDDAGLLVLLNAGQEQVNEGGEGDKDNHSNQRCENGSGGSRNTSTYIQTTPTPGIANNCGNDEPPVEMEITLISAIQGTPENQGINNFGETDVSPLIGQEVKVEAIVVGDFQDGDSDDSRNLRGFYLQEEDVDNDGNNTSSEGIFVFDNNFGVDVNLGDRVTVIGTVEQYFGETQLDSITEITIIASDELNAVTPASLSLLSSSAFTQSQNGNYQPDLEAYEGMLVTIQDSLQIIEQFQLDRFNEITLIAGQRPYQYSQINAPNTAGYDAHLQDVGKRSILYDDGLNQQNANIGNLDGFSGYVENTAPRMGDTVNNLTGVLDYKWAGNSASQATWRVRSHIDGTNSFVSNNSRPLAAPSLDGSLKVASFNVLNFFTTLNDGSGNTVSGLSPRGANNQEEYNRQLAKLVNAIVALDADVLGLVELENEFDAVNDGSTAIEALVNAVNAAAGAGIYDYVYPGQQLVGTDAIAVGFIYKPSVVAIANDTVPALLDDTVAQSLGEFGASGYPIFDGPSTNRVSLATSFVHLDSQDVFTVVNNHFKSKGGDGTGTNADANDGAGNWNQRRLDAAKAVIAWLDKAPTGSDDEDIIVLGDLNAYASEDPVQEFIAMGFKNVESEDAYSYVFSGQVGTLDYLLVSDALYSKFNQAEVWHINADEADALDYNLDFGKSDAYFDATTPTRNSDHDPVIASFDLVYEPTTASDLLTAYQEGVESGSLVATGKRVSRQRMRLLKMRLKLEKAVRIENKRNINLFCSVLDKVAKRSDGDDIPEDWIAGSGLETFNQLVLQAKEDKGCNAK